MKEKKSKSNGKWIFVIAILIFLMILSFVAASIISLFISSGDRFSTAELGVGNVAVIKVSGEIVSSSDSLIFSPSVADSTKIVKHIKNADDSSMIKAILIEINSPGGTGVASSEIADAIKNAEKPTVAYIREVGASGGYWIASAADKIVAHPMSITGSIGVISSRLIFSGLMEENGVYYQRLVSGKYKDIGTPFRNMTREEEVLFQESLDEMQDYFINQVAENRNLPKSKVKEIATGLFYTGAQAKKLGLIDTLGGKEEAIKIIEKQLNISANPVEFKEKKSLASVLSEFSQKQSFLFGSGMGSAMFGKTENSPLVYT